VTSCWIWLRRAQLVGSENRYTSWCDPYECSTLIVVSFELLKNYFMWNEYSRASILVDSVLWCICSVMMRVRQSVVGVVNVNHFFRTWSCGCRDTC
jgi:hypothetical protein